MTVMRPRIIDPSTISSDRKPEVLSDVDHANDDDEKTTLVTLLPTSSSG